jgi:hypothetical protein
MAAKTRRQGKELGRPALRVSIIHSKEEKCVMAALAIPVEGQDQSLSRSTVILQIKFGLLGDSRKVSSSQVEVDTDKQLLRIAKKILVSAEFEAIRQLDRKAKKYLEGVCVPFETGTRFVALLLIEEVDRKLHEFAAERADLVERFLDIYPALCESMSERLRVLHNPTDYPPVDIVKARFYFTWRYLSYGVPGQLKTISGRIWQEEREKAAEHFAEAQTEAQTLLRESMAELVSHMVERLETSDNGKPKVFKKSTVANLSEFLATFDFRNIANDSELKGQVDKARALLAGVTAEEIRNTADLRFRLKAGMSEIAAKLDTMMVAMPRRKFRLED